MGGSNLAPIIIAVVIIGIIAAGAALFFLHVKKLLPQGFYNTFGPRWKPVNTSDEEAEDESKHPNILKNKEDLDETAKSEEGVNLNNMTTVTWTTDEKQEDLKKENLEKEEDKDEKPAPVEEKKEEEKPAAEEEPLKKEEE